MKTLLIKIKSKTILFKNIQGYVGIRHYILPYLISKDKILSDQLKRLMVITKENELSSDFKVNLFSFASDRILFKIVNEDKTFWDDSKYLPEDEKINQFQKIKKRIFWIYKTGKYNETNIDINNLKKYLPNGREFGLFLFDFFVCNIPFNKLNKSPLISSIFPNYYFKYKDDTNKFLSYYDENNISEKKISQLSESEIKSAYNKLNRKVLINLAFIGNKGSGKSTTVAHLLYSTGFITKDDFINISNLSNQEGKPSYKYSWLIDNAKNERNRLRTFNIHIKKFETKNYDFNLIDMPGDLRLKKNLIRGISLADAAVIIVSAEDENYKNDYIKDYIIFSFTMRISQIIIAINKMDKTKDLEYSEKSFLKIKKYMKNLCKNIGYNIDQIQFIPFSGFTGQNLVNKYDEEDILKKNKMEWYKGKTLLESLDEIKPPKRSFDSPLKISIFNCKKVTGVGTVLEGKILSGKLIQGMELYTTFINDEIFKTKCESIAVKNHLIKEAISGDIIGFHVKGISESDIKHSSRLMSTENYFEHIKNVKNMRVKILIVNEYYKYIPLKVGDCLTLYSYTSNILIQIENIEYLVDQEDKILEKEPKKIFYGDYAIITINFIANQKKYYFSLINKQKNRNYSKHYFEKYTKNQFLGSFELFDAELVAIGKIKDINVL